MGCGSGILSGGLVNHAVVCCDCCPGVPRRYPGCLWATAHDHCLVLVGECCWQFNSSSWWCLAVECQNLCCQVNGILVETFGWCGIATFDGMVVLDGDSQGSVSWLQKLLFLLFLVAVGAVRCYAGSNWISSEEKNNQNWLWWISHV